MLQDGMVEVNMKTILVVDDDNLTLALAKSVLSEKYKVVPVIKGKRALAYLENSKCDIILLDINMPEMDGFEVLSRIREMEQCRNIPVIFLTADIDAETETRCFKEGAVDFIGKPFVPDVMLSRISRLLELEELRNNLADRLEQKTREVSDIKRKSQQDALTGLWDRIYTEEKVNEMLESGTEGALFMIDIDNFKPINDNYGHMAGDETLKMLGNILRELSSEGDVICRIGGDEFVVFLKDVISKTDLKNRASELISTFESKVKELGYETNTSLSIGISTTTEAGKEFNKLYNSADKALYHVKENGKKSYHFFSDRLRAENSRAAQTIDLKYLKDLMHRSDSIKGPYCMDFESFHHVYHFICRLVDQSRRDAQMLLFTINKREDLQPDEAEAKLILDLLEEAVFTSMRRSDVFTRYSDKQLIVILMDTNNDGGGAVAKRIVEKFDRIYTGGKVYIDHSVSQLGY